MTAPELLGSEGGGLELMSLARLRDNPDLLRAPESVIPRIAWSGRVTLLPAREKAGKSTLAAAGVSAMTCGRDFLGESTTAGDALWLSADMESAYDIDQRFQAFGADADRTYLAMNWDRRPLSFLAWVARGKPRVAVIDTLATYAGELVTDAGQASQWVAILRDICAVARDSGTAFVLLHHANRATGEYRDSTHIGAAVDCILTMREDPLGAVRRITARGRWPLDDYAVRLAGDRFELVGRELTVDARILLHLQGNPGASLRAVRAACGGRHDEVDVALDELMARGAVVNIGTDKAHKYVTAEGKALLGKDGHPGARPGHASGHASLGAPTGECAPCPSPRRGGHGHTDGSEQPELLDPDQPANCPDCGAGADSLTCLAGLWQCEACARALEKAAA